MTRIVYITLTEVIMEKIKYYITTAIPTTHVGTYLYGNPPTDNDDGELHDIGTMVLTEKEFKQLQALYTKIRKARKSKSKAK